MRGIRCEANLLYVLRLPLQSASNSAIRYCSGAGRLQPMGGSKRLNSSARRLEPRCRKTLVAQDVQLLFDQLRRAPDSAPGRATCRVAALLLRYHKGADKTMARRYQKWCKNVLPMVRDQSGHRDGAPRAAAATAQPVSARPIRQMVATTWNDSLRRLSGRSHVAGQRPLQVDQRPHGRHVL